MNKVCVVEGRVLSEDGRIQAAPNSQTRILLLCENKIIVKEVQMLFIHMRSIEMESFF